MVSTNSASGSSSRLQASTRTTTAVVAASSLALEIVGIRGFPRAVIQQWG